MNNLLIYIVNLNLAVCCSQTHLYWGQTPRRGGNYPSNIIINDQYNSMKKAPPFEKSPPLVRYRSGTRGGLFSKKSAVGRKFSGFQLILLGKIDQKRFRNTFLKRKNRLREIIFLKKSRLRRGY